MTTLSDFFGAATVDEPYPVSLGVRDEVRHTCIAVSAQRMRQRRSAALCPLAVAGCQLALASYRVRRLRGVPSR